ncbi:MAG: dinitrogenase iron-molybdenum cofactor biosynthesis protein [Bacteroidales bacterium]|jgi:predicted Fe-Mo cluster-binding NifX family protein|nr:dinitrogenase iron-molybdenum cofactor biosynthesis protein [Bacteroidales bacterium]
MNIVITASGNSLESKFDMRFGRCTWFCVYNSVDKTTEFFENENKNINGGAGTKSAAKVAELGAKRVISGDFGPKAKSLLEKFNIQMIVLDDDDLSVENIVDNLKEL